MLCSKKVLVATKFLGEGWCWLSRFSVENFLSHSAEIIRRGPFCAVFQKISGIENISKRGGGSTRIFRRKRFCLTVPKIFVGEPFSV